MTEDEMRRTRPPIRAVAVDDEPLGLGRIRRALERHPDIDLIEEISDGNAAVSRIPELRPDLLFLDIRMPGRDGFEVLTSLPADVRPLVVFVTAYDAHALRAFEVHAADYLVKPFDDERFDEMIAAVRERLFEGGTPGPLDLEALLKDMTRPATYAHRVRVTDDQRTSFVPVSQIRYLEADGNYVAIHTTDDTHRIRVTLSELHDRLDPSRFVRVHRGTVLNLDYLREIQPWFSGAYVAILESGEQLRISRGYREEIMKLTF